MAGSGAQASGLVALVALDPGNFEAFRLDCVGEKGILCF